VKKADAASSVEESAELYNEAEKRLAETFPGIPLWYNRTISGHSENVKDVKFDQSGDPVFTEVEVFKK
jgi:oligopeptide transport system substrate-binding protein